MARPLAKEWKVPDSSSGLSSTIGERSTGNKTFDALIVATELRALRKERALERSLRKALALVAHTANDFLNDHRDRKLIPKIKKLWIRFQMIECWVIARHQGEEDPAGFRKAEHHPRRRFD